MFDLDCTSDACAMIVSWPRVPIWFIAGLAVALVPIVLTLFVRWLRTLIDERVDALLQERLSRVAREMRGDIAAEVERLEGEIGRDVIGAPTRPSLSPLHPPSRP